MSGGGLVVVVLGVLVAVVLVLLLGRPERRYGVRWVGEGGEES